MKPKPRAFLALATFAVLMALFTVQRHHVASVSGANYTGLAQISGPLQLDLVVSPPVGAPRDLLQLRVILTNGTEALLSPEVDLVLPSNIQVASAKMPPGATLNLRSNSINWLPVIPGHGATKEMTLPLKVTSADLNQPERAIEAMLSYQERQQTTTALIWTGIAPRIRDITSSSRVSIGQPLQLTVETEGPGPLTEIWDLGDGRRLPLANPAIAYPAAGVYNVTVTVKNPLGEDTRREQITVHPHVAADFQAQDETPGLGETVQFINESGGQKPVRFTWSFGDGTTSNEAQPEHRYDSPGSYEVSLVVENQFGRSETTSTIMVGLPPQADILVDTSAPAGELLTGAVVGDQTNAEYAWAMGDGREYRGAKVSHAYRQTGDYYVTLTANNEFGSTSVGRWVHVEPGTLKTYMPLVTHLGGLTSGSSAQAGETTSELAPVAADLEQLFTLDPLEIPAGTTPEEQLLLYVNAARTAFDLPPLRESAQLSAAAQNHADDMAAAHHTQHVGSDGSSPAERQLYFGYLQGYSGEATAWGFEDPRLAVEFWVNSPSHRPIILNRYATEVGLGYAVDYSAPSVWYWTSEFGNSFVMAEAPVMRVLAPGEELEMLNSDTVTFTWNWPQQLSSADRFTVYMIDAAGSSVPVGSVQNPMLGTRYGLALQPLEVPELLGAYQWQLRLENSRGLVLAESERRSITINQDPALPTPTPEPTAVPTAEPTVAPSATPTASPVPSTPLPRPTDGPLPAVVTATPLPTP